MRGTPAVSEPLFHPAGIIPAYAGNTLPWISVARGGRDHPRVCGEHILGDSNADIHRGSSPRMRGTPEGRAFDGGERGIIPAYAGNTIEKNNTPAPHKGSSPRMRGTQWR